MAEGLSCFFAALWLGGAISLTLKQFFVNPTDGMELYGITSTLEFVDDFIIWSIYNLLMALRWASIST